jgi:hypothetical protein
LGRQNEKQNMTVAAIGLRKLTVSAALLLMTACCFFDRVRLRDYRDGYSARAARSHLHDHYFTDVTIRNLKGEVIDPTKIELANYRVVQQWPSPGSFIPPQTAVFLVISADMPIPDYTDSTAQRALRHAHEYADWGIRQHITSTQHLSLPHASVLPSRGIIRNCDCDPPGTMRGVDAAFEVGVILVDVQIETPPGPRP